MHQRTVVNLLAGVLVGLVFAWLLGLFSPRPVSPTDSAPAPLAASVPAKPIISTVVATRSSVTLPTAAAVPAHAPDPAPTKASGTAATAAASSDAAAKDKVLLQAQRKRATNNLRMLGTAAQQYMLDHGVNSAAYYDLVGFGTDSYIRTIDPASDEDYSGLIIYQEQTQISISSDAFGTVTYNL